MTEEELKPEYDLKSLSIRRVGPQRQPSSSHRVVLDPDVDAFLNQLAEEKEIDIQQLVNEWLRANIKLIKSVS